MPTAQRTTTVNPKRRKSPKTLNKSEWAQLISDYEAGQLSQQMFCQKHRISVSSFHKWRKLLKNPAKNSAASPGSFIEVVLPSEALNQSAQTVPATPTHNDWQVELDLGKGVVLRLRGI
jgi:transposase-like protein